MGGASSFLVSPFRRGFYNSFMTLSTYPLVHDMVYGPFPSRRLGASLGINILPFGVKLCSFNCNYCQCGWTYDLSDEASLAKYRWPSASEVAAALERWLREASGRARFDAITLAGNGEPTLHPDFLDVVNALLDVRDRHAVGVPLHVLSNGANLHRNEVVAALNLLDERHMKLDAGSESMFLDMNSPTTDIGIWDILQGFKRLKPFIIQTMFTRGRRDNTAPRDVDLWIEAVRKCAPKAVHVYSLARAPADASIVGVPIEELREFARLLTERTGIACEAF